MTDDINLLRDITVNLKKESDMKKGKKIFNVNSIISRYLYITFFSIIVTVPHLSLAQTNEIQKKSTHEESKEKILENQAHLKEEIQKLTTAIELHAQDKEEILPPILEQKLEVLQKIDLIYEQQLIQIKRSFDLMQTLAQLREGLSNVVTQKPLPEPPYSFSFLDELKEKLVILEGQNRPIEDTIKTATASLQATQDKLKKTDQDSRRIKEELEVAKKEVVTSPAFIIVELSKRLTGEEVTLKKYP